MLMPVSCYHISLVEACKVQCCYSDSMLLLLLFYCFVSLPIYVYAFMNYDSSSGIFLFLDLYANARDIVFLVFIASLLNSKILLKLDALTRKMQHL